MTSLAANPVLIVDDEQTIRLGFSVALRSAGFEVDQAATGEEAVERLAKAPPDCVLLDLRMPGMNGLETARAFRAAGYRGPIVLASAFADHTTAVEAIGTGITDFLTKPVKPTELRYAVNHALSRHVRFSKAPDEEPQEIASGLLRAYAKYCISQQRRNDAKAALTRITTESEDLQSLLLLGALYELDGQREAAAKLFVRAADLHANRISIASSTELFKVFSHSDHNISD